MIALLALAGVVGVGSIVAIVVVLIGNSSSSPSTAAGASWTADPARVATFTQDLVIDRYALKGPAGVRDLSAVMGKLPSLPGLNQQFKLWIDADQAGGAAVTVVAYTVDIPAMVQTGSDEDRRKAMNDGLAGTMSNRGLSITEKSAIEDGTIGGLTFSRVRMSGTAGAGELTQTFYGIMTFTIHNNRGVCIFAMSTTPPGTDGYAKMESILYSFRVL